MTPLFFSILFQSLQIPLHLHLHRQRFTHIYLPHFYTPTLYLLLPLLVPRQHLQSILRRTKLPWVSLLEGHLAALL